jgi:hypothetical protein
MVTLPVDYNRWGPSRRVEVRMYVEERPHVHIGDTVCVVGDDDVPRRLAVVEDLIEDGKTAVLAFEHPWPD